MFPSKQLEPLSIIYERSWRTEVPEEWMKANITPVYKKGKKDDPGNYRPISLTSVPGKITEQLVLGVISKHIEDKEIIGRGQHGFTKGYRISFSTPNCVNEKMVGIALALVK
ncbi:rna-directed dna polymerase from mobile element jockey- hypothetical protein [Limosa lapponica baueri]|uniref:Reverse transcriptase domain-containing protein n=1 Tax=Limosa lapponica baueri TaxID=1758121 RepID=A0A2I0U7Y2_LIMLA|nr:rna-directed dna polymerase from mobile element jockey- hypothetical protein [Limosa lapponica baueri]